MFRRILGTCALVLGIPGIIAYDAGLGRAAPTLRGQEIENPFWGRSCHSPDPAHLCLALKYVVFSKPPGSGIASPTQAASNLKQINRIWSQCDIQFEIERFKAVPPKSLRLNFRTSSFPELDRVRSVLASKNELLIVTTGAWNGPLGAGKANAWTTLPGGSGPFGAVLEQQVAYFPNIIAHELGHYLNLSHANDVADLMNPVIYQRSTYISGAQCHQARTAAETYWQAMLR